MKTGSVAKGKTQNYTQCLRIPSTSKNPSVPELGTGQEGVSQVPGPSVNTGRWKRVQAPRTTFPVLP